MTRGNIVARVLIVTLVYMPDTVSTAALVTELAEGLQRAGHEMTVLTSVPHYNPSDRVRRQQAYRTSWLRPVTESRERDVRVLRVYMPQKGSRVWARLVDYALFQTLTTVAALLKARRQDVVLVVSPPITLGVSGLLLARLAGARFVYNVQELWPDAPVRMGMIRRPAVVRAIRALERYVYRHAAAVTTIARAFEQRLRSRGVAASRIRVIPNFVDVDRLRPQPKDNAFAREHDLAASFVALYAGNIGLTQGLEVLVDAGIRLRDSNVTIVIVGAGVRLTDLRRRVEASAVGNVRLLPFQPAERVPDIYATADVCLVPLKKGFAYDTAPSKVYSAMAAGRAVIACAEEDSETARLLRESGAGCVVPPESVDDLVNAIRGMERNPERRLACGAHGRSWIVEHGSRDAVVAQYDRLIRELTDVRHA